MLRDADNVWRERSFSLKLSLAEISPGLQPRPEVKDWIMLQGRFDLVLFKGGDVWLVDYKSDNVPSDAIEQRAEFYLRQLSAYAEALERIEGGNVRSWLYFIRHGIALEMTAKVLSTDLYPAVLDSCRLEKTTHPEI